MIDPHIFRAYDIRGTFGTQITPEACKAIGRAFGYKVADLYGVDHPRIAVGRDARTHGPELEKAVIKGLVETGCHVFHIGQTPSPVNYFTICTQELDGGIQVTASHNPKEDNGLKLQIRGAEAVCGEDLQRLREDTEQGLVAGSLGLGTVIEYDAITPYIEHLVGMFGGMNASVALDTGNGVAGPLYKEILETCGCTVTGLYIEPDGTFPNHAADPIKWDTLKELQDKVEGEGMQIGLAFDGDGDRLGIVDDTGTILTSDQVLLLLAQDHLQRRPDGSVVFTVSNSGILISEIQKWGGEPIMCRVGHSFVEHVMHENGSLLGGEQSGHFFCAEDYFNFDDALVAALRVLRILQERNTPLSKICADFPKVYQAQELRPGCSDEHKTRIVEAISNHFAGLYPVNVLDGARIDFGDGAWAGIRQSNTSPCLSVCLEARSPEKLEEITEIVLEHLGGYPEIDTGGLKGSK